VNHKVYRLFDKEGNLLYVGVTSSVAARFAAHEEEKAWWHEVNEVKQELFDTREEAFRAEKVAIRTEDPTYNKIRYGSSTPKSSQAFYSKGEGPYVDVVGPKEMAERLGVQHETVHKWRYRQVLPEPALILSGTPMWEWETIKEWWENRKAAG
jgi:predicted GIY-YIG superfamily endonuclease